MRPLTALAIPALTLKMPRRARRPRPDRWPAARPRWACRVSSWVPWRLGRCWPAWPRTALGHICRTRCDPQ